MAFLCPVRIRRNKKKHGHLESDLLSGTRQTMLQMGRITGSASIETLVRVGIEKEHGLSPDSKMIVLHDFTPCVDDELEVHRGQIVNVLYQENDWVYVISENQQQQEGFIPFSYCAPIESIDPLLPLKKKMPRSGPGSVVSGGFNELPPVVIADPPDITEHYRSNSAKGDLLDTDVEFIIQNLNNNDTDKIQTGNNIRSNYSPNSSIPAESASVKLGFESGNIATTTGSVVAPSRVSTYSEGGRSSARSTSHSYKKSSTLFHNVSENNYSEFSGKKSTTPVVASGNQWNNGFGKSFPSNSPNGLRGLDSYLNNTYNQTLGTNYKDRCVQLGELQPFFKDSSGRHIVLYTFLAREENDISVERGEVVTVLNKDDTNWYWVMKANSLEGFVPSVFICPAEMLLNAHHAQLVTSGAPANPNDTFNKYNNTTNQTMLPFLYHQQITG